VTRRDPHTFETECPVILSTLNVHFSTYSIISTLMSSPLIRSNLYGSYCMLLLTCQTAATGEQAGLQAIGSRTGVVKYGLGPQMRGEG
jgi:hypothetical protein